MDLLCDLGERKRHFAFSESHTPYFLMQLPRSTVTANHALADKRTEHTYEFSLRFRVLELSRLAQSFNVSLEPLNGLVRVAKVLATELSYLLNDQFCVARMCSSI